MKILILSIFIALKFTIYISAEDHTTIPNQTTVPSGSPVWVYHPDYVSDDYYGDLSYMSISLKKIPSAGKTIHDVCSNDILLFSEGWCPETAEQAKRVYSELVVQHFMPKSHAAGVLDESEIFNIPSGIATGWRTKNWGYHNPTPNPIDNAKLQNYPWSITNIYGCGPIFDDSSWAQSINLVWKKTPTIGFTDETAYAPNHCTVLGSHGGYGDSFDDFTLTNVDCDSASYVMCYDYWEPWMDTHGGFPLQTAELSSVSVDILRAAFDLRNNPESPSYSPLVANEFQSPPNYNWQDNDDDSDNSYNFNNYYDADDYGVQNDWENDGVVSNPNQIWTSHSMFESCSSNEFQGCYKKYYTLTELPLSYGGDVEQVCDEINAYPWCPESIEEAKQVYSNLALVEYSKNNGDFDIEQWVNDRVMQWTGIVLNELESGFINENTNKEYTCVKNMWNSEDGIYFPWSPKESFSIYYRNKQIEKCVFMGYGFELKLGLVPCFKDEYKARAVCVTTKDMSNHPNHEVMDLEAPEKISPKLKELFKALQTIIYFTFFVTVFIFSGCCVCCCFCCCCKPCRSNNSEPVNQNDNNAAQVINQAPPGYQQFQNQQIPNQQTVVPPTPGYQQQDEVLHVDMGFDRYVGQRGQLFNGRF